MARAKPPEEPKQETLEEPTETIDHAELARRLDKELSFEQGRSEELLRILQASTFARGLAGKIAQVQLELEDVPRQGHADVYGKNEKGERYLQYSYDYITEADLMKGIRPLLAKHGVAVFYSDAIVDSPTREDLSTTVRVSLTFVDGETGEERTLFADGYSIDRNDKGANKAKTAAVRYLLWKTFLQPSDEDAEGEDADTLEAATAAADTQARVREAAAQPRTRRSEGQDRRPQLRQRIQELSVELDEVQGNPAGRTMGELGESAPGFYGAPLPELPEGTLVVLGKALADHVTDQREAKEAAEKPDEFAVEPFELPKVES